MIKIKWSELSDRERDVLVAEYVTKLELYKGVGYFDLPHYTTSIADAWQVVEKLHGQGFQYILEQYGRNVHCTFIAWVDCSENEDCDRKQIIAESEAPTAPEAICLAALKAVGVDVE